MNRLVESPVTKIALAVALAGAAAYSVYHQKNAQAEHAAQTVALVREDIEKLLRDRIERTRTRQYPLKTIRSYEKLLESHQRDSTHQEFLKELATVE